MWYDPVMSTSTVETVESTILARVIAPDASSLPPAVASEPLKWRFPEADKQRMAELAAKARHGTLTIDEHAEIEGYERVSSFLGLVKSMARRSLQASPGK
jgi:hypothetical protein